MPRKDKAEYQKYMREYMRAKRQGLTEINNDLIESGTKVVGGRGLEPLTSAMSTQRSNQLS